LIFHSCYAVGKVHWPSACAPSPAAEPPSRAPPACSHTPAAHGSIAQPGLLLQLRLLKCDCDDYLQLRRPVPTDKTARHTARLSSQPTRSVVLPYSVLSPGCRTKL